MKACASCGGGPCRWADQAERHPDAARSRQVVPATITRADGQTEDSAVTIGPADERGYSRFTPLGTLHDGDTVTFTYTTSLDLS